MWRVGGIVTILLLSFFLDANQTKTNAAPFYFFFVATNQHKPTPARSFFVVKMYHVMVVVRRIVSYAAAVVTVQQEFNTSVCLNKIEYPPDGPNT